ncbi:MAG: efflux RND transporter periplasmic adaptor subunit [Candidatus Cloacimonetes bacterium]|nr:efflux RND transporter periplasmic adaptor subunit [Candidatus Cloacimonadota bacterium]
MDRIIEKKKWNVKKILWILVGAVFSSLILYLLFFADHAAKFKVTKDRLTFGEIVYDYFQDYITVNGIVEPIRTIYLDAQEGGRVEQIRKDEGAVVEKGDVIMTLSNTNLHLEIMNREAAIADQMNNLRNTRLSMEQNKLNLRRQLIELDYKINLQRREMENNSELFSKEYISQKEYQDSKEYFDFLINSKDIVIENQKQDSLFRAVQVTQLEASIQRMQESLELVRERLENLQVKAPVRGLLASVNAEIGEAKVQGERLGQIHVLDEYKIRMAIDEHYISRIHPGLIGHLDYQGKTLTMEIKKIYPEVRNGTFTVDLIFQGGHPDGLKTGQTLRIKLELGESKMTLLIPRGGFFQSTGGRYVFVTDPSGKFAEKRDIRLGRMNPAYFEVLDGLKEGDKVIISSYENFGKAEKLILK